MAKGFSLAGAIGGTGQAQIPDWLYKQRATEAAGGFDDPFVKEISQSVFTDPNKYHRIYEKEMSDATAKFIADYIRKKQNRDSDMSSWLLIEGGNLIEQRKQALNRSQELKDLEQLGMGGKRAGLYVSPSVLEANSILSKAQTPDEYMAMLQEAQNSGRISIDDPYFQFNSADRSIATNTHNEIDYTAELNKLWKGKMYELGQYSYGEGAGKVTDFIYGIPKTKAEAQKLADRTLLETGSVVDVIDAFSAGKNWFNTDYTARSQYMAEHPELIGKTNDEIYESFYRDVVDPTVPTIEKEVFRMTSRPGFTIQNYLSPETSASFQGNPETSNIYVDKPVKSLRTSILSKKPEGVDVQIPNSQYLRRTDDGNMVLGGTTKNLTVKFNGVAVWPSMKYKDKNGQEFWKVLDDTTAKQMKDAGYKVTYQAFATGNYPLLTNATTQEFVNVPVYIPLYESGQTATQNKIIGGFSSGLTTKEKADFNREVEILRTLNGKAY